MTPFAPRRLARRAWRAMVGAPMPLPAPILDRFPMLAGARWRCGGLPPRIGGWMLGQASVLGITLGRTVFLAPHAPLAPGLLLHELAHVHQFERDSAFPVLYLWESLRHGYRANRFELEANGYAAHVLTLSSAPPSGA